MSPISAASGFHLVASFSWAAIRINVDSMALILLACLGGKAEDFRVVWLRDWCFKFTVSSKSVGLLINYTKNISNYLFSLHFALWRNGGPDSVKEKAIWERLQEEEWQLVSRHKSGKQSYAEAVRADRPSVFSRIRFPEDYYVKNYSSEKDGRSSHRLEQSADRASKLHEHCWNSRGHFQNSNLQ